MSPKLGWMLLLAATAPALGLLGAAPRPDGLCARPCRRARPCTLTLTSPTLAAALTPPVALTREAMLDEDDQTSFSSRSRFVAACAAVGSLTGVMVAGFKTGIILLTTLLYGADVTHGWVGTSKRLGWTAVLVPALGGLLVAALRMISPTRRFGPGLAGHVAQVERGRALDKRRFATRSAAAVVTLGTGNALGPEGPSVEIGCGVSRIVGALASKSGGWRGAAHLLRRQRQLLAAGAAAGVAAGFNAPLAGVFFALEVVAAAVRTAAVPDPDGAAAAPVSEVDLRKDSAELDVKSRTAISGVVLSALVSAVVSQELLGLGHALTPASWPTRLRLAALPLYIGLGAAAGAAAIVFRRLEAALRALFAEADGGGGGGGRLRRVPLWLRPACGGLLCGCVGVLYPQVLFFGYSTLDAILASGATDGATWAAGAAEAAQHAPSFGRHSLLPALKGSLGGADGAPLLPWPGVGLLAAKLLTTSACVASGLVGGTFAPSLLLGATLGVAYQQAASRLLGLLAAALPATEIALTAAAANVPAFAMVGAGALLSSVFRAPLTAALLLFELTRGYELVLPLLCAAGTGPLVYDAIERRLPGPVGKPAAGGGGEVPEECDVDNRAGEPCSIMDTYEDEGSPEAS